MNNYKEELFELMTKRKSLELKIKETLQQIEALGLDNRPLIDSEGFPAENLDFGQLTIHRNLKRHYNEMNNDYTALMKQIEQLLVQYHSQLQQDPNVLEEMQKYEQTPKPQQKREAPIMVQQQAAQKIQNEEEKLKLEECVQPFAYLTEVTENSPAHQAGLQVNDHIISFGAINHSNHNNLANLTGFVKENINKPIQVQLLRPLTEVAVPIINYNNQSYIILYISLTPKQWQGQGVLGYILLY